VDSAPSKRLLQVEKLYQKWDQHEKALNGMKKEGKHEKENLRNPVALVKRGRVPRCYGTKNQFWATEGMGKGGFKDHCTPRVKKKRKVICLSTVFGRALRLFEAFPGRGKGELPPGGHPGSRLKEAKAMGPEKGKGLAANSGAEKRFRGAEKICWGSKLSIAERGKKRGSEFRRYQSEQ